MKESHQTKKLKNQILGVGVTKWVNSIFFLFLNFVKRLSLS